MRRRIFSAALFFALLLTSACGRTDPSPAQSQPEAASSGGAKVIFTDDLGQELSIDPPRRVAVMIGSFADVWLLAEGEDQLVATANDAWESYELPLGEDVINIGSAMKPSAELVLAAQPDLVIASSLSPSNLELRETFDRSGIPAAYFNVDSVEDFQNLLSVFCLLTGHTEISEQYALRIHHQVDSAKGKMDGSSPTVLTIQASGSSVKVKNSTDNVLGPMLKELGCVNIADRDGFLLEDLSLEAILQADPDFIFAVYHGTDEAAARASLEETLLSNPAWASLRAVQKGRFLVMDRRMYNLKPNALWGDAYEQLAQVLYEGDKEYVLNET